MDTKLQNQAQNQGLSKFEDVAEEMIDRVRESEYLDMIKKLRLDLADKSSECELLKIKLEESNRDVERLDQELNRCKLTMFENSEDSRKTHEEVMKSKKLEEDYVKLMSDFLVLGEKADQYRRNLVDNYLAKTNAINNYECLISSGALTNELEECKKELDNKMAEVNLANAKLRNLEEEDALKEKSLSELRRVLDDAKVTHKHEINVLEEYITCLKNTITSYEKTLASYIESKSDDVSEQ